MKLIPFIFILVSTIIPVKAQEHYSGADYVTPKDLLVQQKLSQWQDIKFGLLMHWGTYSQWGIVESWSICPEDEGWTKRQGPYSTNYYDYVKAYEKLQTTFNPVKFAPERWAIAAIDAGMKYVVFTTKHHDGFCMFDTKETDYRITSPKTPFSTNPKRNITKEVFDAFRKQGFMIGAYFSKPDWHSPDYWWPYFPAKDRNVNYDPKKYPEKWQAYKQFTYNQVKELMTGYGGVDILWLDGGWVRPANTINKNIEWQRDITFEQDIDMAGLAKMSRSYQPGLLVVDRTVTGEFENYVTPEQSIPGKTLDYPWESCITMGSSWSYVPGDKYKSTNDIVHMLLKIISRGGNLLLNIGPSPEGEWSDTAYSRLKEIGSWMKVHGDAIYKTVPLTPYEQDNIVYLQSKDKKDIYVYVLSEKGDQVTLPSNIQLQGIFVNETSKIVLLDAPAEKISLTVKNGVTLISIPESLQKKFRGKYAAAFKITNMKVYYTTSSHTSFPDTARREGFTRNGILYDARTHYMDSSVMIILPNDFKARESVDLVFWFHGWFNNIEGANLQFELSKQFNASGSNGILVLAETAKYAPDGYGGKLEQEGEFARLVNDVLEKLKSEKVISGKSKPGKIILAGHSGAYRVIAHILQSGKLPVSEVILFDGLYEETEKYVNWIQADPRHRFIDIYTDGGGTDGESREMAKKLINLNMPVDTVEENLLTPAMLQSKRILFIHSLKKHNDVINRPDNFKLFLENDVK